MLLKPDGTIVELNRKEADWRDQELRGCDRQEDLGRADAQGLSAARPALEARGQAGGQGRDVQRGSDDGARGRSDRLPRHLGPAGPRPRRQDHLSAVRGARHHRLEGRAGAASPEPEDGGARPADRRHRARLQQSADGGRRRARYRRQAGRGREAQALRRERAVGGRARRPADRAIARLQPGPAARGAADPGRAADRQHAAAAAQRARPGDREALRPRRRRAAGDGRPDPARGRRPQPGDQRPRFHARRRRPDLPHSRGEGRRTTPSSTTATISSCRSPTPARG